VFTTEKETIRTRIWREEAEPDNPFSAAACYCHGYNVYGEVVGKAGWIEFLYVLFRGEPPSRVQSKLLEDLAVGLANPGPRDHSVRAAMNGAVGGSHSAACLIAALGVGAGQLGGAREIFLAMEIWNDCGIDLQAWANHFKKSSQEERADVWKEMEHSPGFDPHGGSCATPVVQFLRHLANQNTASALRWLDDNRQALETMTDSPLAMTGVAAAAFHDLGFTPEQGEMLFLLLRLPGAAAHALEQKEFGYRNYPFFNHAIHLENDPGPFQEQGRKSAIP
jgi:citrate synthase